MKIATFQIDNYIQKINGEKIAGALVYGPSESVVSSRVNFIAKKIVANLADPFLVTNINKERFSQDSSCLADEFYSYSMLGGRKLIMIKDADAQAAVALKSVTKDEDSITKSDNFILIQAGDLDKSSALRKLCELSYHFAAIACYEDDDKTTKKFIEQQLARNGLKSTHDAVNQIAEKTGKNRQIIASEINKIATYLDGKEITIDAINLAIQGQAEIPFDDFVNNFVAKNYTNAIKSCEYLLNNGFEAIMLIRFLSNYLQKLYNAKSAIESQKSSFEEALSNQRLFYKAENDFRKNLKIISLPELNLWLKLLEKLEIKIKTSNKISPKILFFAFLHDSISNI